MNTIQEQFNANPNETFTLTPGEHEGPLTVDRSCVIDGGGSTLWAGTGPVLIVSASGVTIRNLRVEVTGRAARDESGIAIKTSDPTTRLEDVEVRGRVSGLPQESDLWDLPSMISLGEFAAGQKNTFSVDFQAPSQAVLDSRVKDLSVSPTQLVPGPNRLALCTNELRDQTILYGEILVHTMVTRRIYVTGKALAGISGHCEMLPVENKSDASLPVSVDLFNTSPLPAFMDESVQTLKRGQRIPIRELHTSKVQIIYEHGNAAPGIDIDSYCFALQKNGIVSCDEALIFFGNPKAADGSIQLETFGGKPMVSVDLEKVNASIDRIAVCYSIYGEDPQQTFARVSMPVIRILGNKRECFRFEMNDLSDEKTVVALELYRYKEEWKLKTVGAGYKSGLKQLCESYGVDVE